MTVPPAPDTTGGGSVHDRHKVIRTGQFPFPILAGGRESRQLVWVRHHANYMARKGWLDYIRAISAMLRGAIVNILIGLPFLILVALGVAALSVYGWGFRAAAGLLVVALAWVIVSPIGERLWAVLRIRNTIAVGTNSSVAVRDRLDRAFGAVIVLIVVAATFESLSFFLDDFHFWTREQPRDGRALASIATFSLAFLSIAGRVLPRLRGKGLKAAIVVVGVLGLVSPLLVVMFVADYLVYTGPTSSAVLGVLIAGLVLWLIVVIGILVGMSAGALSRRNGAAALAALVLAIVLIGVASSGVDEVDERQQNLDTRLAELDLSLNSVPQLRFLVEDDDGNPVQEVSDDEFRRREQEFRRLAENTAERPLPEVTALIDFLDVRREELDFFAADVADLLPKITSGETPEFPLRNEGFDRATAGLPGLYCLATTAALNYGDYGTIDDEGFDVPEDPCCPSSGDRCFRESSGDRDMQEAVLADLDQLDYRMLEMSTILDARDAGPEELVQEVLAAFDEDIINDVFGLDGGLANDFPTLSREFEPTFRFAQEELREVGQLLRELRIEANRVAIFSSQYPSLRADGAEIRRSQLEGSAIFAVMLAALLWAYVWIAVDPNRTSLHRLYRDRLAMAFLVGADTSGDVDVEEDLDLGELSRHEACSTAPYHLLNAAVNLQSSKNIDMHDRKSDFFIFSKRFVGSEQTGYCRSETMERAFPEMSLSTAMAVSGAAASPAMGRITQPALVALMTILNIRLGFWIPNPGRLENKIGYEPRPDGPQPLGFTVDHVIASERQEVERRWIELGTVGEGRKPAHGLLGLACSGGGIRSATLNLGIAQALHQAGVFDHVDYLSTVSGGGFFGSSVSSAMRSRVETRCGIAGSVQIERGADRLEVTIEPGDKARRARRRDPAPTDAGPEVHRFGRDATLCVEGDAKVKPGTRLLDLGDPDVISVGRDAARRQRHWWRRDSDPSPFSVQFRWRVKPSSLLREFAGQLNESSRWVNVSDGGHIENLGVFELLRRRCRFIVVGDAEHDPEHEFGGLTIVMRAARLELDTRIAIDLDPLRPDEEGHCAQHWAMGRIHYPGKGEAGYLLYLKSSLTGDEDEDIVGYHVKSPDFPHEGTADQFFDEGQFEAYRRLGYHIAKGVLGRRETFGQNLAEGRDESPPVPFDQVQAWFESLVPEPPPSPNPQGDLPTQGAPLAGRHIAD